MQLKLLNLQPSDVKAWAELDYFTFKQTIGRVLWKRDPSPETWAKMAQDRIKMLETPDTVHHKVVDMDVDSEKPIAFASWEIIRKERSQEEIKASVVIPNIFPERNLDAVYKFWEGLFPAHTEVMGGRPHIYLEMLATHPDYQRCGAGSMLVQWAVEEADKLGLEVFIEASPPGRFLYSKFGFETVKEILFKGAPFGVDVDELTSVSMLMVG
jgi:ribosomal protein S18 acetylase RimI-like enzyme